MPGIGCVRKIAVLAVLRSGYMDTVKDTLGGPDTRTLQMFFLKLVAKRFDFTAV